MTVLAMAFLVGWIVVVPTVVVLLRLRRARYAEAADAALPASPAAPTAALRPCEARLRVAAVAPFGRPLRERPLH